MTLMSRVREHTYTVVENEAVGDGIWRMVFRAPKLAGSLEPGQFMNFHVPGAKQILRVPLSFASADAGAGTVKIVYAVVGDASPRPYQDGGGGVLLRPRALRQRLGRPQGPGPLGRRRRRRGRAACHRRGGASCQ